MRPSERARRRAAGALLLLIGLATGSPALAGAADELDAARRDAIAAARDTQDRERGLAELRHRLDLLGRDADARRRGLADSRPEQQRLLGALEFLARHPPDNAPPDLPPLARLRGRMLASAAVPALHAQAAALSGEIGHIAALDRRIAESNSEATAAEQDLAQSRERLAALVETRRRLTGELLPQDPAEAARLARLGHDAKDLADLVKRADAAAERRDKEIVARTRAALPKEAAALVTADTADPTRPAGLRAFEPPQSALLSPVSGATERPPGAAEPAAPAEPGLDLAAAPGGEAVATFDGRVIYAGGFRDLGLVLIIDHGHGYHSLLAGLGRIDVEPDQWVLAGEPVGGMAQESTRPLHFELRRDGRPVDPQPWLATRGDRLPGADSGPADERNGDQRVRQ